VTADHVNPERAWPALAALGDECDARGLQPRTATHGLPRVRRCQGRTSSTRRFAPTSWPTPTPSFLARNDAWASGTEVTPARGPDGRRSRSSAVESLLARYEPGYDFDREELVTLFGARGADFNAVVERADDVRRDLVGDAVSS
jgi:FO synthase